MDLDSANTDIAERYEHVNEMADELSELLGQGAPAVVAGWDRQILPLADAFRVQFTEYMAEKASGGFMRRVLEQRPTKAPIVEGLRLQAEGIIDDLSVLRSRESGSGDTLEALATKAGKLRLVLDEFRRHQQECNGLAQHVFCQDIGFPGSC